VPPVYEAHPDPAPDAEFAPGELAHLVVGNRGRLLDARRTPVAVTALAPEVGAFEVRIGAFEDAGARWLLPLEDVGRFQFALGSGRAAPRAVVELERAVARFDRPLEVAADPAARAATLERLRAERAAVRAWLAPRGVRVDLDACVAGRHGDPHARALLGEWLAARGGGLHDLERRFAATLVSNPDSGEVVKGHAIVLAELGLCPYRGKVVRDPALFAGAWSRARRGEHIVARLAFVQELLAAAGRETVTLYRGAAVDGPLPEPRPRSLVSATFSRAVAEEHFAGGPATQVAVLWRQAVPLARVLMTFVETAAMNERYREAEAVLVGEPGNRAF
jgi:hypothetical protein